MFQTGRSAQSPGSRSSTSSETSQPSERPQTLAYALCDSPTGLLAYMLDAIRPPLFGTSSGPPQSAGSSSVGSSPVMSRPPSVSRTNSWAQSGVQAIELPGLSTVWTPTAVINWSMVYWLPGPEVALRWLANSTALLPTLWQSYSNVPLGITHFRDAASPSTGTGQMPPQWTEAYHRVVMLRRREGRVRFPAWERPTEVVLDIRELAGIVGPL